MGFEPRFDKKCGNGAISEGEQCRSGQGARGPSIRRGAAIGAKYGAVIGAASGAIRGVQNINAFEAYHPYTRLTGSQKLAGTALASGLSAGSTALLGAGIGAGINAIKKARYNARMKKKRNEQ